MRTLLIYVIYIYIYITYIIVLLNSISCFRLTVATPIHSVELRSAPNWVERQEPAFLFSTILLADTATFRAAANVERTPGCSSPNGRRGRWGS